jgi:hypothetical protein
MKMAGVSARMRFPDVPIYDTMPEGWVEIRGATTAPNGYVWINNRVSIFTKEYRHALLRIRNYGTSTCK